MISVQRVGIRDRPEIIEWGDLQVGRNGWMGWGLVLIVAGVILSGVIWGGILRGEQVEASQELVIWMRADKSTQGMRQLGQQFQRDTGIAVRVEAPEGAIDKFIQAAQVGQGPDLLGWAHDRVGDLTGSGLIRSVDLSPAVRGRLLDKAVAAFQIQGGLYGYPIGMETLTLITNREILPQPPESFEAIMALQDQLAQRDLYTLMFDYANFYFSFPLLAARGGYIFNRLPDGSLDPQDVGLNDPGAVAGLRWIDRMVEQRVLLKDTSYSVMVANMVQERLALMIAGPWEWSNLERNGLDFEVSPLPTLGGDPARSLIGVQGLMVNRSSPNPDLVQEFVERYVLTEAGLRILNEDVAIGVPSVRSLAEEMGRDPRIQATLESIETGVLIPNIPEMNAVWTAMAGLVADVVNDRIEAEAALDSAVDKILARHPQR